MKLTIFAICILLATIYKFVYADDIQAKPDNETVTITKHDWLLLKKFLDNQKKALENATKDDMFWQDKYADAEDCVRENVKHNRAVMPCFGDKEL